MPILKIKDGDNIQDAQFPDGMSADDIRSFLRAKYSQQAISGESDILQPRADTIAPYNPSLVERAGGAIASGLKDTGLISDNYQAQQIGKNLTSIGEFLPGFGDAAAGDEFGRAVAEGDKFGMAMAGLGILPIAGDAAKKIAGRAKGLEFKGFDVSTPLFRGTTENEVTMRPYTHFSKDPKVANSFSADPDLLNDLGIDLSLAEDMYSGANVSVNFARKGKVASMDDVKSVMADNPLLSNKPIQETFPELERRGFNSYDSDYETVIFNPDDVTGAFTGQIKQTNQSLPMDEVNKLGMGLGLLGAIPLVGDAAQKAGKLFKAHNITLGGLKKADEFGGIPSPSLAIAGQDSGFDSFGDISLIGSKDSFAKDPTFASDIYSPRTPQTKHKIDNAAARREELRVSGDVDPRIDSGFSSQFDAGNLSDDISRLESSTGNKASFLKGIGQEIDADKFTSKPKRYKTPQWFGDAGFSKAKAPNLKSFESERFNASANKFMNDIDPDRKISEWYDGDELSRDGKIMVLRGVRDVQQKIRSAAAGPQFDRAKVRGEIDKRIKKNQSSFDSYISDQQSRISKGKVFTKWNPNTGTSKTFEANLGNAVKLMKGNIRGGEGFNYGVGSIRAQVAPQLKSMKQIQDRRGQIVGSDEMTMVKEGFDSRLDNLYDDLKDSWAYGSGPSYSDFAEGLQSAAKGDFADFKSLTAGQKSEMSGFFNELANAPTNYFEIKPQRAVDINEFFGAAVPNGTSKEVIDGLKAKGLHVVKYKPDERMEAIKKLNVKSKGNIFFSGGGAAILYSSTNKEDSEAQ